MLIYKEALIAKLTAQIAQLKHLQFAAKAESFSPEQLQLFEEALAEELVSLTSQLDKALPTDQPTLKQHSKNPAENSIRPIALGHTSMMYWLSLRNGPIAIFTNSYLSLVCELSR